MIYQPIDEKIKTWLLRFPAKKTLIWRTQRSIGQSCCSMTSKWSIRWFQESSQEWRFSPERSLNRQKATRVCIRSINQSNRSISVRLLFLFCSRVFISRSNENRSIRAQSLSPLCKSFQFSVVVRSRFQALLYPLASWWGGHSLLKNLRRLQFNAPRFTQRRLNHKISLQSVLGVRSSRLNAKMKV